MIVRDEPICGFCWTKHLRNPLVYDPEHDLWECPVCGSKVSSPDQDTRKFLAAMEAAATSDPGRWSGMIRAKKKGGSKSSKRKRRKPPKRTLDRVGCLV